MKHKKLLFALIVAALVLTFSAIALGAGKNSDNTYVGTWYCREGEEGNGSYLFVYPCHVGEFVRKIAKDHRINTIKRFDWCVDNGYLVIHDELNDGFASISCYLSSDGGKTMEKITEETSLTYMKIE